MSVIAMGAQRQSSARARTPQDVLSICCRANVIRIHATTSIAHNHKVSKSYLPLYLNEFTFRYNHRNDPDIFRALLSRV